MQRATLEPYDLRRSETVKYYHVRKLSLSGVSRNSPKPLIHPQLTQELRNPFHTKPSRSSSLLRPNLISLLHKAKSHRQNTTSVRENSLQVTQTKTSSSLNPMRMISSNRLKGSSTQLPKTGGFKVVNKAKKSLSELRPAGKSLTALLHHQKKSLSECPENESPSKPQRTRMNSLSKLLRPAINSCLKGEVFNIKSFSRSLIG